jgi:CHAT domain-containing protein
MENQIIDALPHLADFAVAHNYQEELINVLFSLHNTLNRDTDRVTKTLLAMHVGNTYYSLQHTGDAQKFYNIYFQSYQNLPPDQKDPLPFSNITLTRQAKNYLQMLEFEQAGSLLSYSASLLEDNELSFFEKIHFHLVTACKFSANDNPKETELCLNATNLLLKGTAALSTLQLWECKQLIHSIKKGIPETLMEDLKKTFNALSPSITASWAPEFEPFLSRYPRIAIPVNIRSYFFQDQIKVAEVFSDNNPLAVGNELVQCLVWYNRRSTHPYTPAELPNAEEEWDRYRTIKKNTLPKNPLSTTIDYFSSIVFGLFIADYSYAFEQTTQIIALENYWIERIAPLVPESQLYLYLHSIRKTTDLIITLATQFLSADIQVLTNAYTILIRRKMVVFEINSILQQTLKSNLDPTVGALQKELHEVNRSLITYALQGLEGPDGIAGLRFLRRSHSAIENNDSTSFHAKDQVLDYAYMMTLKMNYEEDIRRKSDLMKKLRACIDRTTVASRLRTSKWNKIIANLPENACLVDFFRAERVAGRGPDGNVHQKPIAHYYALISAPAIPEKIKLIDLGEAGPIEHAIRDYRSSITAEPEDIITKPIQPDDEQGIEFQESADYEPLNFLRQTIVDPIFNWINACYTVYVVPDGELNRLPFGILTKKNGRYLMEDHEITHLSNARDLIRGRNIQHLAPTHPVVIAAPQFSSAVRQEIKASPENESDRSSFRYGRLIFSDLPGSGKEGKIIAEKINAIQLMGEAATVSALKSLQSPIILHIATHGFFFPDMPIQLDEWGMNTREMLRPVSGWLRGIGLENPLLRSGLVLAGANNWLRGESADEEMGNGFLTAEEFTQIDLSGTELVVLSACETGLGDIEVNEGVIGLKYSLMVAGAKTILISLWKIPDLQTKELMECFYELLLCGKGRSEALKHAQLKIKEKYPDPYYWGAFICEGDRGPLVLAAKENEKKLETAIPSRDNPFAMRLKSADSADLHARFIQLVGEAGMEFKAPPGFIPQKPFTHDLFEADYAIVSEELGLEIHYAIKPVAYFDEPFDFSDFETIIVDLAKGNLPNIGHFEADAVNEEFNADWGLYAGFNISEYTDGKYYFCNAVAIHQEPFATGMILYFLKDGTAVTNMLEVFHTLKFRER